MRVLIVVCWQGIGAASLVALGACSGGGSLDSGTFVPSTPPPIVTASFTFPAGDATSAPSGTAWDIVGVRTTLSGTGGSPAGNAYDTLRVDVSFVQDVSHALPAPGQALTAANQLGVGIALDVDGNPLTGSYGPCDITSPLRPFEYFSEAGTQPGRLRDGNYAIVDPNGNFVSSGGANPAGEAVTSVSGTVFTQSFYLPAIDVFAGSSVPRIGIGVAAHNGAGLFPTDCVPRAPLLEMDTR